VTVSPKRGLRLLLSLVAISSLGGCVAAEYGANAYDPARMPGTAEVADRTQYRDLNFLQPQSGYREAVNRRIAELSTSPMTADAAVEVALLQSGSVHAQLLKHWAQRATFVEDVAERAASTEDTRPVEWKVTGELLSWSTTQRWSTDFGEEYLDTVDTIVGTAAEARKAFYEAVAAAQLSAMFTQTLEAEKAGAELANEQYRSGTTDRLAQAQQHLAYAETYKEAVEARREAVEKREALNRLLNLSGEQTNWALPDRLPELSMERPVFADLETFAVVNSVEAYAGRASRDQIASGTHLRSKVREAYHRMLAAYDLARFQRDTVVPLTEIALGELQLNYNAMLLDVYELLDATREQIEAGKEYVATLADFWIAHAELTALLGGRLPEAAPPTATAAAQTTP
jgi:hypothetical protein